MDLDEVMALPVATFARQVRTGRLSPVDVIDGLAERIAERRDGNAFITTSLDEARKQAKNCIMGPLAGVPLSVKDIFDTAGIRTTYGSKLFSSHVPERTATAVQLLQQAGAIMVGKNNLHEFAWGVTSQNPHWGTVRNPAHPGKVSGGSSGGTAAAIADGLSLIGLGTDTGGSLRIPAACCDVVGFKPPFGVVPTDGAFPLAPSLDTAGPMARTARDCIDVYQVLAQRTVRRVDVAGLRVGLLGEVPGIERIADIGVAIEPYALPVPEADLTPLFMSECAFTHLSWFPSRRDEYGNDAQLKWDSAQQIRAVDYQRSVIARAEWRARVAVEFPFDLVIGPTLGREIPPADCWEPDVRAEMGANTRVFNNLTWPAMAIGNLHIAGPDPDAVLSLALAWEEAR